MSDLHKVNLISFLALSHSANKLKIGKEEVLMFCRMGLTDEKSLWSEVWQD